MYDTDIFTSLFRSLIHYNCMVNSLNSKIDLFVFLEQKKQIDGRKMTKWPKMTPPPPPQFHKVSDQKAETCELLVK